MLVIVTGWKLVRVHMSAEMFGTSVCGLYPAVEDEREVRSAKTPAINHFCGIFCVSGFAGMMSVTQELLHKTASLIWFQTLTNSIIYIGLSII